MKKSIATMTILGLVLTASGLVAPIVWDLYKGRSELTLYRLGVSSIVERKEKVKGLSVLYENIPVKTVSRASFNLKNTGRKPIVREDVKKAIRVIFKENLLKFGIENAFPRKEDYTIKKIDDNTLEIGFDLLNPKDFVTFAVLMDGHQGTIDANARIVGIKELTILDTPQVNGEKECESNGLGVTGIIVIIFSIITSVIVVFMGIPEAQYERKLKSNWPSARALIKAPIQKSDIRSFIDFLLYPKRKDQMEPIYEKLDKIEGMEIGSEEDIEIVKDQISATINDQSGAMAASILFGLLALVGWGYVIYRFIVV